MGLFNIFNKKEPTDTIKKYLENGAIIIDVRTVEEWNQGHIEKAKHIVLQTITNHLEEIKSWNTPIITVCKSGGRSEQAKQFLKEQNIDVINGGPWQNVAQYL